MFWHSAAGQLGMLSEGSETPGFYQRIASLPHRKGGWRRIPSAMPRMKDVGMMVGNRRHGTCRGGIPVSCLEDDPHVCLVRSPARLWHRRGSGGIFPGGFGGNRGGSAGGVASPRERAAGLSIRRNPWRRTGRFAGSAGSDGRGVFHRGSRMDRLPGAQSDRLGERPPRDGGGP